MQAYKERREEAALENTAQGDVEFLKSGTTYKRQEEFQVVSEGYPNLASTTILSSQNSPRWHNNSVACLHL